MTLATADLTAGQQQSLTEHRGQSFVFIDQKGTGYAIDDECFLNHYGVLLIW